MAAYNLIIQLNPDQLLPIAILYVGPETLLPLTSALAAIVGVLLIGWRWMVMIVGRAWRFFSKR